MEGMEKIKHMAAACDDRRDHWEKNISNATAAKTKRREKRIIIERKWNSSCRRRRNERESTRAATTETLRPQIQFVVDYTHTHTHTHAFVGTTIRRRARQKERKRKREPRSHPSLVACRCQAGHYKYSPSLPSWRNNSTYTKDLLIITTFVSSSSFSVGSSNRSTDKADTR